MTARTDLEYIPGTVSVTEDGINIDGWTVRPGPGETIPPEDAPRPLIEELREYALDWAMDRLAGEMP